MNLIFDKFKEVIFSVFPMTILISALYFCFADFDKNVFVLFLIGSVFLIVGLALFLTGADISMSIIGEYFAIETAKSKKISGFLALSFIIGFMVTVAEPDLHILGTQLERISGGVIESIRLVLAVSLGVGVMIAVASLVRITGTSNTRFMAAVYFLIIIISIISQTEFIGVAFDASGATTGVITTPFVLSLAAGFGRIRNKRRISGENENFGMVGAMSTGPVLVVLLLSVFLGEQSFKEPVFKSSLPVGILSQLGSSFVSESKNAFLTLVPLVFMFVVWNVFGRRLKKKSMIKVFFGIALCFIGLMLFLTGIYSGFMKMGTILGSEIAQKSSALLLAAGFIIGLLVVLIEPAVMVLCRQIEESTGGRLSSRLIKIVLALGVAISVFVSMLRIVLPELKLIYLLLPGFAISVILSFFSDPIITGIAYDAGGVASGPLTATFVLAFANGAAMDSPGSDIMSEGFGVIAMVAMLPVLSIMILGFVARVKSSGDLTVPHPSRGISVPKESVLTEQVSVFVMVPKKHSDRVIDLARSAGAGPATILHGRHGSINTETDFLELKRLFEDEIGLILFVVEKDTAINIINELDKDEVLRLDIGEDVFIMPCVS